MKTLILIFTIILTTLSSFGDLVTRYQGYLALNDINPELVNARGSGIFIVPDNEGGASLFVWDFVDLENPGFQALPSLEDAENAIALYFSIQESQRQASKPLEQRQYENQFYALTEQLFNLTGVTNDVTPKLGFPELQAKIEQIQATDPMLAVNLSLKLLTIDAALKRYNTLWWDDAIQHELTEE